MSEGKGQIFNVGDDGSVLRALDKILTTHDIEVKKISYSEEFLNLFRVVLPPTTVGIPVPEDPYKGGSVNIACGSETVRMVK